jgi:hypothetical protein
MNNQLSHSDVKTFMFAGNSIFTIINTKTGNRFTFKIRKSKDNNVFFVSLLTGSDNNTNYSYIGFISDNTFKSSKKSRVSEDAISFKAFSWVFTNISNLPSFVEIWHEGKCGRCGRKLTTPESIKRGLGPECAGLVK